MATLTAILWFTIGASIIHLFRLVRWAYKWLIRRFEIKDGELMYSNAKTGLGGKDK